MGGVVDLVTMTTAELHSRIPKPLHRTLYVLANPVNHVDAYGYMIVEWSRRKRNTQDGHGQ